MLLAEAKLTALAVFSQTAMVDQETADMFKEQLFSRIQMLEAVQYSLLGVGLAVFVSCLIGFLVVRSSGRGKEA